MFICLSIGATWTPKRSCILLIRAYKQHVAAVYSIWGTRKSKRNDTMNIQYNDYCERFLPSAQCLLSTDIFQHHMTSTRQLVYQHFLRCSKLLFWFERVFTWTFHMEFFSDHSDSTWAHCNYTDCPAALAGQLGAASLLTCSLSILGKWIHEQTTFLNGEKHMCTCM